MAFLDWFNPETWKAPAELIGYWKTIAGAIASAGVAFGAATKKGREFIGRGWTAVRGRLPSREHIDLRFVPDDNATYWSIEVLVGETPGLIVYVVRRIRLRGGRKAKR